MTTTIRHRAVGVRAGVTIEEPAIPVGWMTWGVRILVLGVVGAWLRESPGWVLMWGLAAACFLLLKVATLRGNWSGRSAWKVAAYLFLWPGMDAARFLAGPVSRRALASELAAALAKLALGLGLMGWAMAHVEDPRPMLVAWVGMLGLIFTLHFGVFHLGSWLWRRAGVDAPPIMRAPITATSLAELWGARWNVAFADAARRLLLKPLARRYGVERAGAVVFLLSGLVHEIVISVPARGGWGGPTLYFLVEAAGVAVEKSAPGRRVGLGRGGRGRAWTFFVAVAPLPLLFHAPFARHVILPLYETLANALLP